MGSAAPPVSCLPDVKGGTPMAQHVLDLLKERGFIAQMTFEDELYEQLKNPTTFYVGFDPAPDNHIRICRACRVRRLQDQRP